MAVQSESESVARWLLDPEGRTAGVLSAEDVTFEPQVITVSRARREQLLRRAGWQRVSLQFLLRSFDGTSLTSHVCFLQFLGARDETNTARSSLRGGTASFPDFWLKPAGVLRLMCVPVAGSPAEGGPVLEGAVPVPSRIPSAYVSFTGTQDYRDLQIRASNERQVGDQMVLEGNAKFTILGVAEVGGGATSTTSGSTTTTREFSYTVRIARPGLTLTPVAR